MNTQNFPKKVFLKVMSLIKSIVPADSHVRMIFSLAMIYQTSLVQENTDFIHKILLRFLLQFSQCSFEGTVGFKGLKPNTKMDDQSTKYKTVIKKYLNYYVR